MFWGLHTLAQPTGGDSWHAVTRGRLNAQRVLDNTDVGPARRALPWASGGGSCYADSHCRRGQQCTWTLIRTGLACTLTFNHFVLLAEELLGTVCNRHSVQLANIATGKPFRRVGLRPDLSKIGMAVLVTCRLCLALSCAGNTRIGSAVLGTVAESAVGPCRRSTA